MSEHLCRSAGRLLGGALVVLAWGCATEEKATFGDPNNVTTSGGQVAVTTGAPSPCDVDPVCNGLTWTTDIYKGIINSVGGTNPGGGCTAVNCHRTENGKLTLSPTDEKATYQALVGYTLKSVTPSGKYIVPCKPAESKMVCNLLFNVSDEDFKKSAPTGQCGSPMPKIASAGSPVHSKLNQLEFNNIVQWITCGAPHN